jgi:hypothetical protein
MNQNTVLKTGGIILQKSDLQSILVEPDTLGLAFVLYQPGVADNVDLQVVKVKELNGVLVGEVKPIAPANKKAAISNFHHPAGAVTEFQFNNLAKLKSDGYYFGYLEKATLLSLFASESNWTEVFIGGGQENYPADILSSTQTDWFNFMVILRQAIPTTVLNQQEGNARHSSVYHFPPLHGSKISVPDMVGIDSNLLGLLEQKVEQVLLATDGKTPVGLKFENDTAGLFDSSTQVTTLKLDEDQKLKFLYTATEGFSAEESIILGDRLPYYRRPLGCPPVWHQAAHSDSPDNSLRNAIDQALKSE